MSSDSGSDPSGPSLRSCAPVSDLHAWCYISYLISRVALRLHSLFVCHLLIAGVLAHSIALDHSGSQCIEGAAGSGDMAPKYPPPIVADATGTHTATLIMLHGLGDTGDGWADVAKQFKAALPHVKFIFPTAAQVTAFPCVPMRRMCPHAPCPPLLPRPPCSAHRSPTHHSAEAHHAQHGHANDGLV